MACALLSAGLSSTAAKRYCWTTPIAIPSKAVLTQNNQKLLTESAQSANNVPATPTRFPTKEPSLRPSHPINCAAGKVALIQTKNCNATGKVTHIADGANC